MLSELEGAIMLEVHMRGRTTAFQVRSAFLSSPTQDWSGSAGAVYPAIRRLEDSGYIYRTAKTDGRGTQTLSATDDGIAALHHWAVAPDLSAIISADPFRTRSDYLRMLPSEGRADTLYAIRASLVSALTEIKNRVEDDQTIKKSANELVEQVLQIRIDWMDKIIRENRSPS